MIYSPFHGFVLQYVQAVGTNQLPDIGWLWLHYGSHRIWSQLCQLFLYLPLWFHPNVRVLQIAIITMILRPKTYFTLQWVLLGTPTLTGLISQRSFHSTFATTTKGPVVIVLVAWREKRVDFDPVLIMPIFDICPSSVCSGCFGGELASALTDRLPMQKLIHLGIEGLIVREILYDSCYVYGQRDV